MREREENENDLPTPPEPWFFIRDHLRLPRDQRLKRFLGGDGVKRETRIELAKQDRDLNKSLDDLFGPYEEGKCRVCGDPTGMYDSNRRHYCSDRCFRLAKALQRKFTWEPIKEAVKKRDEHTCQDCGKTNKEAKLVVHHITPISEGGHPFEEENLVTLCTKCHGKRHSKQGAEEREEKKQEAVPLEAFIPSKEEGDGQ